jgi:hypothetical protein
MLSEEMQRSLEKESIVKYSGNLWVVCNRFIQIISIAGDQGKLVAQTNRLLSAPTPAELLAARLTGRLTG